MAHLSNSSWRANAACMACGLLSHILVEPSMSVNRKVTVPEGGLATTTSMCSSLPLRGHYSSAAFPGPSVQRTSENSAHEKIGESTIDPTRPVACAKHHDA